MGNVQGLVDFRGHFFAQSPRQDSTGADLSQRLEAWKDELDSGGVDHMVALASRPGEAAPVSAAARESEGRLIPFAYVDPTACESGPRAEELVGRYGYRGFLLFPAAHGFSMDNSEVDGLLEVASATGAPVVVHCGLLAASQRDELALMPTLDINLGNPLAILPAAVRYPKVSFVIPHFGAGFFRETLMAGEMCENVYVDTSSGNSWIRTQPSDLRLEDVFERTLGVFGPGRILFGTDSQTAAPGWRRDLLTLQREALGALEVPAQDQMMIFRDNARRLLAL